MVCIHLIAERCAQLALIQVTTAQLLFRLMSRDLIQVIKKALAAHYAPKNHKATAWRSEIAAFDALSPISKSAYTRSRSWRPICSGVKRST